MDTNIAILLGAESSIPAGFPSTQQLTELVVSGHGITRCSDGTYNPGDKDEQPPVVLRLVTTTVRRLHAEAERYYSAYVRRPNYEAIYYLARQALDEETGNMENPAVRVFVNELKADMSPLVKTANEENEDPNEQSEYVPSDLTNLLKQTCNYIEDVVSKSLLRHCPASESQLSIIEHVCKSADVTVTSISTLCHDTHVETFLSSKGVALSDGFSAIRSGNTMDGLAVDPPHWNADLTSDKKTPLLKLHGSVNWYRYDGKIRRIPANCYPQRIKIGGGFKPADCGRPLLLIGTFNKMSDYSSGIALDLHCRFRSTMRDASRLVICGYSFGDKGINREIVYWIHNEKGRRFVIIHPEPERLKDGARVVIQKNWDKWEKDGSIRIIPKPFECVDIADLKEAISS